MNNIIERVIGILKEKDLDAIWVSDGYNMRYISGFTGGTGSLYISENKKLLLTDSRYTTQAANESKGFEIKEIGNSNTYLKTLNELLENDNAKTVGFEDEVMIVSEYEKFSKESKAETWVPLKNSLDTLRRIKTAQEIKYLETAESIGDKAFSYILNILKPGMTEIEVAVELEGFMKKNGAAGISFDSIIASGINSAMPHATPSHKKIEKGDFVTMDFGCVYEGYCSDMTRTVVVGKASEKQKEIYHIVLEAQLAALEGIRPGITGSSVDKIARDIIKNAGYEECFGHGLGHSVGLFIHENPRLSPLDETILEENMIETVEPGIYIPNVFGVRIEDMVVITKDGHRNLAHSAKELIEL